MAVPATPPQDHWETAEGEAVAIARSNLEAALSRFREVGLEVHVVHRVDAAFDLPVTHVYSRSKVGPPGR